MGYPFNSPAKELGMYVQGNGETAYFSSGRAGGKGGMDIYQVTLPEEFRPAPSEFAHRNVLSHCSAIECYPTSSKAVSRYLCDDASRHNLTFPYAINVIRVLNVLGSILTYRPWGILDSFMFSMGTS